MKNDKLFIPTLCKVGFQARSDTYTGKLGYIIAFDGKKWRKEPSWKGWCVQFVNTDESEEAKQEMFNKWKLGYLNYEHCDYAYWLRNVFQNRKITSDESFKPIEFSNVPTSGFTLNKDVRRDGYWGNGHNMIRVYDPRGFEFEISVINLLFILMYTDCNSRELMGEMVYSWNGKDLVLLPVGTQEYQSSVQHTADQHKKVSAKDITPGIYKTKQGVLVKYLGKFRVYENNNSGKTCAILEKQHVFVFPEEIWHRSQPYYNGKTIYQYGKSLAFLSHYVSENVDHAEDVEAFLNSKFNYQVDYSKPIYEVQENIIPVMNYGGISFYDKKDCQTFATKIVPLQSTWRRDTLFTGKYETIEKGVFFENIHFNNLYVHGENNSVRSYNYNDNGVPVQSGGFVLSFNGTVFGYAAIKEDGISLYKGQHATGYIKTLTVDHNEFIHNIVIQKLVGYETTNGKIHNV